MKIEEKATTKNILIRVSRAALAFLRWITFGKVDLEYERRTTTLGRTMYTGTGWKQRDAERKEWEINHEQVHVQQWETWGPLYYLTYLLNIWHVLAVPVLILTGALWWIWIVMMVVVTALPAGLSLRAYWEFKAFKRTLLTLKGQGHARLASIRYFSDYYTDLLCGKPYLYAARFARGFVRRKWTDFLIKEKIGWTSPFEVDKE